MIEEGGVLPSAHQPFHEVDDDFDKELEILRRLLEPDSYTAYVTGPCCQRPISGS